MTVAKARTFVCECAREAPTRVIAGDSPGPAPIFFVVEGGLIDLDKALEGGICRVRGRHYRFGAARKDSREAGLDLRGLDALVCWLSLAV
jgi:2,4'-dihydroxyacetophenone dioxygenase